MLQIETSKLKSRKNVEIDGHPYVVRKPGAGEQLAMSQKLRQLGKYDAKKDLTDEEQADIERISNEVIKQMAACFNDGGDGTKSMELVSQLSPEELQDILAEIFKDEAPKADTGASSQSSESESKS